MSITGWKINFKMEFKRINRLCLVSQVSPKGISFRNEEILFEEKICKINSLPKFDFSDIYKGNVLLRLHNITKCKNKKETILVHTIIDDNKIPLITSNKGNIYFYFDLLKSIENNLFEDYLKPAKKPIYTYFPYSFKFIPRRLRNLVKKLKHSRNIYSLPNWPLDPSIEILKFFYIKSLEVCKNKFKKIDIWPKNYKYCVVLTHDVESKKGLKDLSKLLDIERKHNVFSTINFISNSYKIGDSFVKSIKSEGFDVGCHGYNHDNRLIFLKDKKLKERFENMNKFAQKHGIHGFRSPSLMRSKKLFEYISKHFKFDSSIPDTERNSQMGVSTGCGSIYPFYIGDLLEIPLTLPQDSNLVPYEYMPEQVLTLWLMKLKWIKKMGGIVVLNTHSESHLILKKRYPEIYDLFLSNLVSDRDAWITTLQEVYNKTKDKF